MVGKAHPCSLVPDGRVEQITNADCASWRVEPEMAKGMTLDGTIRHLIRGDAADKEGGAIVQQVTRRSALCSVFSHCFFGYIPAFECDNNGKMVEQQT